MSGPVWHWIWPGVETELMVSRSVSDVFSSYRQNNSSVEKGGQLFVDPTYPSGMLLSFATIPHYADRAGRTWLELDAERCREEIENANEQGLRLVGYWHTHPQVIPQISSTDILSFTRFSQRYAQELPYPIAVIVGTSPSPEGVKAWSIRAGTCIEALRINEAD